MQAYKLKWLMISQSTVFFASSLIFPFYILFIKNVGTSFTQFGLSYGLFALSSALIHPLLGKLSSKLNNKIFLIVHSWGMALVLLYLPLIHTVVQVYMVQIILGLFGAMQKHGEKVLVANYTDISSRGEKVGSYHFWTSICSAFAIMLGGFLVDYFTIDFIFYMSSIIYFSSGVLLAKQ
jgi:MFS family permease